MPRRVLAQHLRGLRQQAGLTVKVAATVMEWSEPKMWRIETGQTAVRALDVEAMCAAYGAAPGITQALAKLARQQTKAHGWWHAYGETIITGRVQHLHDAGGCRVRGWRGMRPSRCQACCAPSRMPAHSSRAGSPSSDEVDRLVYESLARRAW